MQRLQNQICQFNMYKYLGKISWTIIDGKKYGLGGDVHIERTPPKLPEVVKECTQEEYEFLLNKGLANIVYEPLQPRVKEQHTRGVEGPVKTGKPDKKV